MVSGGKLKEECRLIPDLERRFYDGNLERKEEVILEEHLLRCKACSRWVMETLPEDMKEVKREKK